MADFDFESFKHTIKEYDTLISFVDTQLAKVTNGASRGAWGYSIDIEPDDDDAISISYVDRWDDGERIRLTWDEFVDDSGEKYRERHAEELRMQQERSRINIREAELKLLAQARATIARLELKHASE